MTKKKAMSKKDIPKATELLCLSNKVWHMILAEDWNKCISTTIESLKNAAAMGQNSTSISYEFSTGGWDDKINKIKLLLMQQGYKVEEKDYSLYVSWEDAR
jgi:hypothetical protein